MSSCVAVASGSSSRGGRKARRPADATLPSYHGIRYHHDRCCRRRRPPIRFVSCCAVSCCAPRLLAPGGLSSATLSHLSASDFHQPCAAPGCCCRPSSVLVLLLVGAHPVASRPPAALGLALPLLGGACDTHGRQQGKAAPDASGPERVTREKELGRATGGWEARAARPQAATERTSGRLLPSAPRRGPLPLLPAGRRRRRPAPLRRHLAPGAVALLVEVVHVVRQAPLEVLEEALRCGAGKPHGETTALSTRTSSRPHTRRAHTAEKRGSLSLSAPRPVPSPHNAP